MEILYANKKRITLEWKKNVDQKMNEKILIFFVWKKQKQGYFENEWMEGKFKCNNEKEKSYSKEWNWKISKSLRENIVPVGMKERKTDIMAEWMKEKYIYCAKWMEEKKYSLYEWKNSV